MDGATGTALLAAGMPPGACTEQWILENPEALLQLQRRYAAAGCDVITAPTFGATGPVGRLRPGGADGGDQPPPGRPQPAGGSGVQNRGQSVAHRPPAGALWRGG